MPFIDINDARLHYEVDGQEGAPWLILSNSLGTHLEMWDPQMPALRSRFRVLRYDTRGHGMSAVPEGPYSVEQLGRDVVALMDELGIARAHFCGLSMGGMTGMWLGVHAAERIDRLVLCNTSALIGPAEVWNTRIAKVNSEGMDAIVQAVIDRWFTPAYQQRAPEDVAQVRDMLRQTPADGYTANCAAVRDMDQRADVAHIKAPTLVIAGTHDLATPAKDGKAVADSIPGARYIELDAAHLSNWEQAERFTATLVDFLTQGA
ncbi:3-oxoadipate enol-lactonase [Noviherbaspirillum sp. Root189]|uniref:3-oxoadipate enol-lactonase n=1 Tax=Noviherbaspirillum sp. Root189 TaxID=1736487 RepID=UPI00070D5283|nr:3-oxoadipate enol-lactonase [Noviherbaspirillum sp. Root189]KRB73536.1 3-oxoadipate enol-lactonase [Noviherbaspirillum sp. Root189]